MKKKGNLLREIRVLFSGWELLFQLAFLFAVNFGVFYLVSGHTGTSIAIGIIGSLFFFRVHTYENKKLKKYQDNLNELFKYVKNMSFFLGAGENTLYSLEMAKKSVNKDVQRDIEKTIQKLRQNAEIDTKHFSKYAFPTLEQFHQNLAIQYERGGDSDELYGSIQRAMMFELKKRDELYRKRKGFAMQVYVLLGMVGSTSLILRFMVSDLWDIFLNFSFVGIGVLVFVYLASLLNLYFLQMKKIDISVRL